MATPLISIILPTYNRCDMLQGALECLVRQETHNEFNYEIVVIDNASSDGTRAVIEQVAADSVIPVRYFYQSVPGDAPTRNCGLAQAQGSWLAFVDDDELATPNWLHQLFRAAIETGALVVGGAVHLDLTPQQLSRLNRFVRATSLREIDYYPKLQPYTDAHLPGTCNALVAKQVVDNIGVFDATKVFGGSDSDFFLRAKSSGETIYYTPHAIVRHRVAPNRLTTEYFRWDAQQGSTALADIDYRFKGTRKLIFICIARIAHALLVLVPKLIWGWLTRNQAEVLGQRVRLWRMEAYVRRTLSILAPTWLRKNSISQV